MKINMGALIDMVIGLVFILIALLIGPWYSIMSALGIESNIYLTRMEIAGVSIGYSNPLIETNIAGAKSFFDNTLYLTIIALITAIIALVGILIKRRMIGVGLGILTFIFALIAPLYFMTGGFVGEGSGFWNEYGGPGYAWYLMIIAAIIALISGILSLKKQVPVPAPPRAPTPPPEK